MGYSPPLSTDPTNEVMATSLASDRRNTVTPQKDQPFGKRRRVQFSAFTEVSTLASPLDHPAFDSYHEDNVPFSLLWYSGDELDDFRRVARDECIVLRKQQRHRSKRRCMLSVDSETRGLEQRVCVERQRRRYVVGKYIVANSCHMNSGSLAALCKQSTRYATDLAVLEAVRDFAAAYPVEEEENHYHLNKNKRLPSSSASTASKRVRVK